MIKTFRQFQEIENHMSSTINPETTLDQTWGYLQEEMIELHEALGTGDRKKIASEIPDVIIFMSKIANHFGIDLEEAISMKLARNGEKYQAGIQRLVDLGLTHEEARTKLKTDWNRADDHKFDID